jgi:hypothetical protein
LNGCSVRLPSVNENVGAAFRHQRDRVMPAAGSPPTTRNGADSVMWLNLDEVMCDQIMHDEGGCAAYGANALFVSSFGSDRHSRINSCLAFNRFILVPPSAPVRAVGALAHRRRLGKSQKIRTRLGRSPNMLEELPDKPKGMHWRTYERWCRVHDAAEERSTIGLMSFVERLGRRTSRRA